MLAAQIQTSETLIFRPIVSDEQAPFFNAAKKNRDCEQ
jgi:hypothetical protein